MGGGRRQAVSTNDKIQAILDNALRATIPEPDKRREAKLRRRLRLYCAGTGAPLPKVGGVAREAPSSEVVVARSYEHDAWYRLWCEGERQVVLSAGYRGRREPWYGGRCPSGIVSTSTFADAVRYGFRGTANERRYRRYPNSAPDLRDEWTPALRGSAPAPGSTVLFAPRLWPENSQYVSGFRATHSDQRPTSSWYATQTTTAAAAEEDEEISLPPRLRRIRLLRVEESLRLERSIAADRRVARGPAPRPRTVEKRRTVRYSGPQTFVLSGAPEKPRANDDDENNHKELRWRETARFYKTMLVDPPVVQLRDLAAALSESADPPGLVSRHLFASALEKVLDARNFSLGRANLLFSLFAGTTTQLLEYVRLLACLVVLSRPDWAPEDLALALWRLSRDHGKPATSTPRRLEAILETCAQSADDLLHIRHVLPDLQAALTRTVVLRPPHYSGEEGPKKKKDQRHKEGGVFGLAAPITDEDLRRALEEVPAAVATFDHQLQAVCAKFGVIYEKHK